MEEKEGEKEESSNNRKIPATATALTSEKEKGVNDLVDLEKKNNNNDSFDYNNAIPLEIDIHFQMYGKHAWEVEYGEERCQICNRRIDEFGFCACGSQR